MSPTNSAPKKPVMNRELRTVADLMTAGEDLYNRLDSGGIDAKTADAMNTVLKSQRYFVAELPMQTLKITVAAMIKKVHIPEGLRRALPLSLD
jgi:hypothetical protein